MFYIFTNSSFTALGLIKDPKRSDMDFISGVARDPNAPPPTAGPPGAAGGGEGGGGGAERAGASAAKASVRPDHRDRSQHRRARRGRSRTGKHPTTSGIIPRLKGLTIPRTGRAGRIGTLVTKTLLIAGEGGLFTTPSGQRGAMLRAYDKATGKDVGEVFMPAPQTGSLMTYSLSGRQYIVVPISGGAYSGEFVAFRLPMN